MQPKSGGGRRRGERSNPRQDTERTDSAGCARSASPRAIAAALERQRQEQEIILDSMPALVWYKDRENRIIRANRAAAESMGTTPENLVGRSTYELYPEEAAKYHRDDLEVIDSGQPKLGIEELLETGSGQKRWVRTDKIPYRDEHGEIVGVIVFAVDVTDHKHAEEALRQARDELDARVRERTAELAAAVESLRAQIDERQRTEKQLREHQAELAHVLRLWTIEGMAAEFAHEINQPLGAIANFAGGMAARLRDGRTDPAQMIDTAEQISDQAVRAALVIRRVREFARKDALKRVVCDLNELVRDATRLVEPDLRQHRIALHLRLTSDLPPIHAACIQIEQVILNLLRNGVDSIAAAGASEGELVGQTMIAGGMLEVTVRDSGTGIAPDAWEKLFAPFFTTRSEGLGLGLSISRSIIESHGGRIWVGPKLDRGAIFGFSLPAFRAQS